MILKKMKKELILIVLFCTVKVFAELPNCEGCDDSTCFPGGYCLSSSGVIKLVNSNNLPGSTKFGKSGTPTGNFFFKGASGKFGLITDGTDDPDSGYKCDSSGCNIIDGEEETFINSKATGLQCAYVFSGSSSLNCNTASANLSYYDDFSKKVINCSSKKCSLTAATGYYINYYEYDSGKINRIITCNNNLCKPYPESSSKAFYLNAGLEKSTKPIIKFDGDNFSIITGDTEKAFLDKSTLIESSDPFTYTNLITCSSDKKCSSESYDSGVFLSSVETELIKCEASGCTTFDVTNEGTNLLGNNNSNLYYIDALSKKLIYCDCKPTLGKCNLSDESANKYYLDYNTISSSTAGFCGNSGESFCSTNIISCDSSLKCKSKAITSNSNFIDGETVNNLIICNTFDEEFFCTSALAKDLTYYYVNSGNTDNRPILYCGDVNTQNCVPQEASTIGYYKTDDENTIKNTYKIDNTGYLIKCYSETRCEKLSDVSIEGYYINSGINNTGYALIEVSEETNEVIEILPTDRNTYYLDSSSFLLNTYSNLIYCSTIRNCTSIEPNDGYYYNISGDDANSESIITCDKTGCSTGGNYVVQKCTVNESMTLYPGNYCLQRSSTSEDEDLNFVVNEFTIDSEDIESTNLNITYASSGPVYHFITVKSGNFPGISSTISTLFEVTTNTITRVVDNGVYIINSKNEKVESMSGSVTIGSIYSVYICSKSTQICSKTTSCATDTYLFDEESNTGYFCSGKSITPITDNGYYVDSSYVVNNSLTPAVLKCDDSAHCERYTPTDTYFINAGSDNDTKVLIHCSSRTCTTTEGAVGYYKAEFGNSGVIVCTSSTNCKLSSLRYDYYINGGEDKFSKPVIGCNKYINCDTKKVTTIGYYLVQENNNLLIHCKSLNSCEVEEGSVGYYFNSANNDNTIGVETVIKCYVSSHTGSVICATEKRNEGFYLSGSGNNVLINCMGTKCKSITVGNGIFRSAATIKTSIKNESRDKYSEDEEENNELVEHVGRMDNDQDKINMEGNVMLTLSEKSLFSKRAKNTADSVSSLIICSGNVCNELTAEELNAIPICSYNNEVCYLEDADNFSSTTTNNIVTSVVAGEYCTDSSRSTLYFATETIVMYNDVITGVISSSKTTTKNCVKASSQYSSNLFTVGNNIYRVNDGLITQVFDIGYYFINIKKNILVYGTDIKEYNNSNVLLYKCDGQVCRIMDKPTSDTYYTDVTKRLIKYSVEEDKYSFVNKKENICTFDSNTCTPKYDIEENDFCITAEGYIVVAGQKIKSRETGKCFMSYSISENVLAYSYNSVLYLLNRNAAKKVVTTGYYFAENNKYNSAEYKSFNSTSSGITLYGCINHNCNIYDPQPDIYYFDMITNYLIQKKNNEWISPIKVGFINVSVSPEEVYIYSYTMSDTKELLLTKTNKNGYYYTIDNKMYNCEVGVKTCKEIEDSAYILTNSNEFYYCVVDSEGEETECFKRLCTTGQIYYLKNNYYRCTSGSYLELVRSRTCDHDEVVVINFPLIYSETFPIGVYNSISNIAKNNHYVPTQKISRNSIESFQGVFTNCTYDAYDEEATYDEICMENYVKLNQDKEPDICSVKLLGYTYCTVDDGDDKDKCNPSSAFRQRYLTSWNILTVVISILIIFIIY